MSCTPRRPASPLWGAVPLFVIGLAGCDLMPPRVWVESERIIELSATDVDKLAIYTLNGQVNVQPNPSGEEGIVVVAKIKAGGRDEADAQAALEAVQIETPRAGDDRNVQEVRSVWKEGRASHWQAKVSFDVTIPPDMNLYAESHNGDVQVEGIEARCEAASHNGSIEIRDAGSELVATTHNGSIAARTPAHKVHFQTHNGTVRAVLLSDRPQGSAISHNGKIRVRVPSGASFSFDCAVHNGGIDLDTLPTTHVERSKRSASGRVGDDPGNRLIHLETHNGQVSLGVIAEEDLRAARRSESKPRGVVRRAVDEKEQEIRRRARELEQQLDEEPVASER